MSLDLARAYDLALLQTAANYDLSDPEERKASNQWLVDLYGRLIQAVQPELVLELGAFSAAFSLSQRAGLPKAQFHAFEANPHNYQLFRDEIEEAGVHYHHRAIGESVGACTFKLARRRGDRRFRPTKGNNSLRTKRLDIEYEDVVVKMTTVDHFVREQGLADLPTAMWIDLEGCAYEALAAAARTLQDTRLIMIELEDRPFWIGQKLAADVRNLLADAGFMPLARDFEFNAQYNVIFAAAETYDRAEVRTILEEGLSRAGERARTRGAAAA
jgi:FkbM family methyltransferase